MRLVTSLTVDTSLLRKLLNLWDAGGDPRNPFASVLVTPLFASRGTLQMIREELREKRGSIVYFDSGGYYVQQGKIGFAELYCALRDYYRDPANQWADWYVLPDHVPTSADAADVVAHKVNDTVTAARMFFAEMPALVQDRAIPVIQGHTMEQVEQCLESYQSLGARYIGFGSFGTGGDSSINVTDARSAQSITYIMDRLHGKWLHVFGVSTPPVVYAFSRLGVYSFDSLAWVRSAGYGKAFMPFTRAYNVSHRSTRNAALSYTEFMQIKERTGHQCPFCEDFDLLRESRLHRCLHNLVAVMETAGENGQRENSDIIPLIEWKSPKYYQLFERVYRE